MDRDTSIEEKYKSQDSALKAQALVTFTYHAPSVQER